MTRRKNKFRMPKATNLTVTQSFLDKRIKDAAKRGYGKAKWIEFCEALLAAGFKLSLYEARRTFSKYITVSDGRESYKVRFSNHRPIKSRELQGDCDFFVGVTHTGVRTTDDALEAISEHFGCEVRA